MVFSEAAAMELVMLVVCVVAAWIVATCVDSLPTLVRLLVPSPWLWGALALVMATWLMRDQP